MALLALALLLAAPTTPRVWAHLVPWHPPSHSRPDRALDLAGGLPGMLRAARAAGVEGFTVDLVLGDPAACSRLLEEYLRAAESVPGFTIGPCLDLAASRSPAHWTAVLRSWQASAGGSPAAMRHDGRLVVFTYNALAMAPAEWAAVRAGVATAGGGPYLVGDVEVGLRRGAAGDDAVRALAAVLDACYSFTPFPAGQQRLAALLAAEGRQQPVIYSPSPGYWRPSSGALNRLFEGTLGYRRSWDEAQEAGAQWVVITTWNDYGESTHIEPSRNNGDLLARITAVEAARLRCGEPAAAAGPTSYYLTAPPEMPDGPGRGPLEANPRRETTFEITRLGPPGPAETAWLRLARPAGEVVWEQALTLTGDQPVVAATCQWQPDRALAETWLRVEAVVGDRRAVVPMALWPRDIAHRFVLAPLRVQLLADPPSPPRLALADGRLTVEPLDLPAPTRVDLLHDLQHRPDPRSSTGAVASGAAQLPGGPPAWGFWTAARIEPGSRVSWAAPLWIPLTGDRLLLARYDFRDGGQDGSPYARHAALHAPAGVVPTVALTDGRSALACQPGVWAEPPGSFLPFAGPLSISLWCRPAEPGGMLFGDVGAPLLLSLDALRPRLARHTADGRWLAVTANEPLPLGVWSHLTGQYDGRDLVLYVNAREAGRAPAAPSTGSERMGLGCNPYDRSSFFHGWLTAVEIRGEALAPPVLPPPGDPAG